MSTDPAFLNHVLDLFAGMGQIRTGRMFSGTALYLEDDAMFAAVLGDTVWMKSDDTTEAAYREAGASPFTYDRKTGAREVRSLMSLPDNALEDPDEACRWAALSLPPARTAAAEKRRQKARRKARG